MTYDNPTRLNAQISEEAAEWFVEFRTGDIDAAGRRAFDTWVRSSQEHLRAYLEFAAIWNEAGALDAQRALDVDSLIALARAEGNIIPLERRSSETPDSRPASLTKEHDASVGRVSPSRKLRRRSAIAACAAIIAFATGTAVS